MTRRFLFKVLCMLGLGAVAGPLGTGKTAVRLLTFYVAGVRYHEPPQEDVNPGDRVLIRLERQMGDKPGYAVYTEGLVKLGYVPRQLLDAFQPADEVTGLVTLAKKHAVPWKRYRVEVIAA
jgi:hypothetical protein